MRGRRRVGIVTAEYRHRQGLQGVSALDDDVLPFDCDDGRSRSEAFTDAICRLITIGIGDDRDPGMAAPAGNYAAQLDIEWSGCGDKRLESGDVRYRFAERTPCLCRVQVCPVRRLVVRSWLRSALRSACQPVPYNRGAVRGDDGNHQTTCGQQGNGWQAIGTTSSERYSTTVFARSGTRYHESLCQTVSCRRPNPVQEQVRPLSSLQPARRARCPSTSRAGIASTPLRAQTGRACG